MIERGTVIALSDEETLLDAMNDGNVVESVSFIVDRVREFNHDTGVSWKLVDLQDCELVLVHKSVDDINLELCLSEWKVYYKVFEPDSRQNLVEDNFWLFNESEEEDVDDLEFADEFVDDEGKVFSNKFGTLAGEYDGLMFLVTEWSEQDYSISNPEVLCIELGDYLMLLQGCNLADNDIEVFPNGGN